MVIKNTETFNIENHLIYLKEKKLQIHKSIFSLHTIELHYSHPSVLQVCFIAFDNTQVIAGFE